MSTDDQEIFEEGRKILPDFTLGSYEEVLRLCQREAKVACVILVSEEHDDVTEFKRCGRFCHAPVQVLLTLRQLDRH
jgi:FAS-associated factor 2